MSIEGLVSQVKSLEAQLEVVKAQLKRLNAETPRRTFGDFYGAIPGGCAATDEDFEAAKYKFPWEGELVGGR